MADRTGLEPATSGVTGRHSNQLNYRSTRFENAHWNEEMADRTGLEPATSGVTGRHSNQLNYRSAYDSSRVHHDKAEHPSISDRSNPSFRAMVGGTGLEPVTPSL